MNFNGFKFRSGGDRHRQPRGRHPGQIMGLQSPEDFQPPLGQISAEGNRQIVYVATPRPQLQETRQEVQITASNPEELISGIERRYEEVKNLTAVNNLLKGDLQTAENERRTLQQQLQKAERDYQRLDQDLQKAENYGRTTHQQLSQLQKDCRSLEYQRDEALRKLGHRDYQVTTLTSERNSLKQTEQSLNQTIRRLELASQSLHNDLDLERSTVTELRERLKTAQRCIRDFEGELERAKDAQQVHAEDVRKAQESAFQLLEQAQWMPEADRDVTRKLNNLHSSMINWCKTYACKTAMNSEDLSEEDQARIERILSQVAQQVNERDPFELDDLGLGIKGPVTLLLAALAHAIYGTIFNNPFFFENSKSLSEGDESGDNQEASAVLYKIYMDICKIDKKGANLWRSQTLRLLDPQAGVANPSQEGRKDARGAGAVAAAHFSADFISGDAQVFLDSGDAKSSDEREGQLTDIAIRAAELAYKLWTQRTQLESLGIEELPKKKGVVRFSSNSEYLEHHPLHNIQLYDDENCLNGKRVVLVIHPAVVAYGDTEGNDYSTRKVWKKAVVWMGTK